MKNLLKLLSVFLIVSSFVACEKKDWTCRCTNIVSQMVTEAPILNTTEKKARKSCDESNARLLIPTIEECELVE